MFTMGSGLVSDISGWYLTFWGLGGQNLGKKIWWKIFFDSQVGVSF